MADLGIVERGFGLHTSRFVWVVALLAVLPLHDTRPGAALAAYSYAWQLFVHGQLTECQREAELSSARFRLSEPDWATKLDLLKAQAMLWRGLYTDARRTLSGIVTVNPEDIVQSLVLEASAFAKQQLFSSAEQRLQQAEILCKSTDLEVCGNVLRARGTLAVDRGRFSSGRQFFLETLSFARVHRDRFMESTALLNLGWAALQSNHYDEAVDWSVAAHRASVEIGAEDLAQAASGNLGYASFDLGDYPRALDQFLDAEKNAARLGDFEFELIWLEDIGYVYQTDGDPVRAAPIYRQALELAERLDSKMDIIIALEELAYAAIDAGRLEEADTYLDQLDPLAEGSGTRSRESLVIKLARGRIAAARRQDQQAENLLHAVEADRDGSMFFQIEAKWDLAQLYETEGHFQAADSMYRKSLTIFESARAQLKNEESRLPFLANAESIYDSYIHFLVSHGKSAEALAVADQSRAQTLAEGLGLSTASQASKSTRLNPEAIAAKSHATLLFYWLGKQESYLWATTARKTTLFVLPPQQQIGTMVDRYRQILVEARDPLAENNQDARALYATLVAPAATLISAGAHVVVCVDGALSKLNFETLIAPGPDAIGHYFIEDANIVVTPSLSMLGSARPAQLRDKNLLMIGDALSSGPDYSELPLAGLEMRLVRQHFAANQETVIARSQATPDSYLSSRPQQYAFIHFVAHGTASQTDPLEAAIILSPGVSAGTPFKLYARDILQHPIDARLVTISACNGSGTRTYSGEGLVGLSWSFLRAGAHSVIAALWSVSDESTPRTMNLLYQGIEEGLTPGEALRNAKLDLLRSSGEFRRPFYWAPFQLYTGR
jgi:CHAT domain-containing protein/Tfp pilus assembly protein PilF